ncbi:MAG: hypothetical protein AAF266_12820 [Planctomycetota bacterium]
MTTRVYSLFLLLAGLASATPSICLAAERELSPVPRSSAGSADSVHYTVAKPADPVWEDAPRLVDNREGSPTAQRRTVYQNPAPDPLNLRGLSNGFLEGTRPLNEAGQRAGEYLGNQARGLAEGTRRFVDQAGDNLRRGTQDVLNGTADTLQRVAPPTTSPYADRTQYEANNYDNGQGYTPPTPTLAGDDRFAQPQGEFTDAQLRDAQLRAEQQRRDEEERARRQYEADTLAAQQREYEERLDRERAARRSSGGGVIERFAEDSDRFADPRAPLSPVQRTERNRVNNDQDAWRPFDDGSYDEDYPPPRSTRNFATDSTGFPELNPPRTDWDPSLARGQSAANTAGYGQQPYTPPYSQVATNQSTQGGTPPANYANSPTDWTGRADEQQRTNGNSNFVNASTTGDAIQQESSSTNLDRLLLVILGAASCFTWLAYYDVRQKYRLALRGVQVGDFGTSAAA